MNNEPRIVTLTFTETVDVISQFAEQGMESLIRSNPELRETMIDAATTVMEVFRIMEVAPASVAVTLLLLAVEMMKMSPMYWKSPNAASTTSCHDHLN